MVLQFRHLGYYNFSTQARRYSALRNSERATSRHGGHPKFPLDNSRQQFPCGQKVSAKVVGGENAEYGDHPWQVEFEIYMQSLKAFTHHCGGAVISPMHVLTAAHCLSGFNKGDLRVKAGDYNLRMKDDAEQMFAVESWRVHPNFKTSGIYSDDIAVVKISPQRGNGFQMSRFVSPVCLPSVSVSYTDGYKCQVTGWGLTDPANNDSKANILQRAEIPLLPDQPCKERYDDFSPGMMCAGYDAGKIDACNGDSGGPLVCEKQGKHTVVGVVSWGISCATKGFPGIYSSTQYYLDWILSAVEEL
ncbi:plasma kallikrein-like isoform X2 [Macrobrachium nipponense]|uniref:plasma kallikrein-like isoform X2 n=1 Tax=Macrobrachium nipponense TaxID=159736 RepID=UPI0030C8194F